MLSEHSSTSESEETNDSQWRNQGRQRNANSFGSLGGGGGAGEGVKCLQKIQTRGEDWSVYYQPFHCHDAAWKWPRKKRKLKSD